MADAYINDRKRIMPCAALCEGEYGIKGYFIGVPVIISSKGVEKIVEVTLTDEEKAALNTTLEKVKATVAETKL